jgi:hypothetical protein
MQGALGDEAHAILYVIALLAGALSLAEAPIVPPMPWAIVEIAIEGAQVRLLGEFLPSTIAVSIKALHGRPWSFLGFVLGADCLFASSRPMCRSQEL